MPPALALVPDYEPDTVIEEVAEESEMHVKVLDEDGRLRWHRWCAGGNGSLLACGDVVDQRHTHGTRYPVLEGDLCEEGCFSPFELAKAALANLTARRRTS
jgi:hypothetical protein